jgi:hypothetical protein
MFYSLDVCLTKKNLPPINSLRQDRFRKLVGSSNLLKKLPQQSNLPPTHEMNLVDDLEAC